MRLSERSRPRTHDRTVGDADRGSQRPHAPAHSLTSRHSGYFATKSGGNPTTAAIDQGNAVDASVRRIRPQERCYLPAYAKAVRSTSTSASPTSRSTCSLPGTTNPSGLDDQLRICNCQGPGHPPQNHQRPVRPIVHRPTIGSRRFCHRWGLRQTFPGASYSRSSTTSRAATSSKPRLLTQRSTTLQTGWRLCVAKQSSPAREVRSPLTQRR